MLQELAEEWQTVQNGELTIPQVIESLDLIGRLGDWAASLKPTDDADGVLELIDIEIPTVDGSLLRNVLEMADPRSHLHEGDMAFGWAAIVKSGMLTHVDSLENHRASMDIATLVQIRVSALLSVREALANWRRGRAERYSALDCQPFSAAHNALTVLSQLDREDLGVRELQAERTEIEFDAAVFGSLPVAETVLRQWSTEFYGRLEVYGKLGSHAPTVPKTAAAMQIQFDKLDNRLDEVYSTANNRHRW